MRNIYSITILLGMVFLLNACSLIRPTREDSGESPTDIAVVGNPEGLNPEDALLVPADPSEVSEQPQSKLSEQSPEASKEIHNASAKGSGEWFSYQIRPGDTLMKIAFETYADVNRWRQILEANRDTIKNPGALSSGMVIKVEKPLTQVVIERNGEKYLIKKGATLGKIASELYGAARFWRKLWENNKQLIHNPNLIFAGFWLHYLPSNK